MEAILEEFWEDVDFSWTWRYQLDNVMAIHDQGSTGTSFINNIFIWNLALMFLNQSFILNFKLFQKPAGLIQRQILYLSLIMWSAREMKGGVLSIQYKNC